ncbi:ABC-three component system protein [Pseudomonas sp. NPDC089752]|uniref:ABC-three component system protein n=1 Tax=Pseudomonas sp. NPDC089752 TaxID=3364472 RepID=UPI00382E2912
MAFDASPSWSGFNYQGKVALHHALTLINAQPIDHDFSKTDLMLEANEDFEIIINDESVSFHQVKAYNTSTFDEYSDALFGLTIELYKRDGVKGFIHTWQKVNDRPHCKGLIASVKNDFVKVLKEYRDTEPKAGTILETAAAGGKNLKKKASILRAALPGLDASDLEKIIDDIIEDKSDALKRLACYEYKEDESFCDLDDINTNIKKELSLALGARGILITDEQLEKAFNYFLGVMDSYIIDRHKAKTTADAKPIKFTEIISAVNFDHEDVGKNYIACRFKDRFSRLIDEYLGDQEDYPTLESSEPCNLRAAQKLLLSLSPIDLWEHYRHFSPQLHLASGNNTDNAFSASDEGIRFCLLKILHGISFSRISQDAERYRFSYKSSTMPSQGYLPTTITPIGRISNTVRQLNSNPCLGDLLFEVRNLIHCGTEVHPFVPDVEKSTKAPPSTEDNPRAKRDDVLPLITLLPLTNAKDVLAE